MYSAPFLIANVQAMRFMMIEQGEKQEIELANKLVNAPELLLLLPDKSVRIMIDTHGPGQSVMGIENAV